MTSAEMQQYLKVIFMFFVVIVVSYRWWITRTRQRIRPSELRELLESWLVSDVQIREWDRLESRRLSDKELENIRKEAVDAVSPGSRYLLDRYPYTFLSEDGVKLFERLVEKCRSMESM